MIAAPSEPVETGPGTPHYAGLPPERFWQEDVAIVVFVNDVTEYCGTAPPGLVMLACMKKQDGQEFIVMPHPVSAGLAGDPYARVMAHELGHHAGWSGKHEE
jgi:hypothetical protein